MHFLELAKERFSIRNFDPRPIEAEKMERILKAGQAAPTATNRQPQRIYVLQSPQALDRIRALTRCAFNANTVLLFAYDEMADIIPPDKRVLLGVEDVSIVATHMMLEAWEVGIGSCWVNYFDYDAVHAAFHLPENEKVVLIMPMGYAAAEARPVHRARKPLSETVTLL